MFFKGSRYAPIETLRHTDGDGRVIQYKARRFIEPTPARLAHRVQRGERLDHIAQRYYRDPELFWRVADANVVLWPDDLIEEPGRTILLPGKEG